MYDSLKEYFGFPDYVDTISSVLGFGLIGLMALVFIKLYLIDDVIFKKCYHGVKFGYVKSKCEKCRNDKIRADNGIEEEEIPVPKTVYRLGHCRACGVEVEKRFRHLTIEPGQKLKYDEKEIDEFAQKNRFNSVFKEQLHLRHYPPVGYYPNYCNNCVVEHEQHNYKRTYKIRSWNDAFAIPTWFLFLGVAIGIFNEWLTFKSFMYIMLVFFLLAFIMRFVFRKFISPKTQAEEIFKNQISEHEKIQKALNFIEKMDKEEAEALERIRLRRTSRIDEIDRMTGVQFEQRLALYFQSCGYSVKDTAVTGDHGADLVIQKDGVRIAVQAKRYDRKNSVGNSAVQEAIAGKIMYDCTECYVITTSYFTKAATELATKAGVRLINRDELVRMLGNEVAS
ncbi:restriction endonuclease [Paenibacillus oenotherae]|uniref:Restriction endonuclease n=1 Tax=Paenibacillus oenotherae TaxID=1435645 RepID=A0ABS7D4H5_9BACL|nr:restriction endonuclease [Paenibacillus oenotherae]MBW7474820.1 restriction endonuclease [Paenibacillus oenotherae]